MNSETFTYWLQGFVELSDSDSISEKQWLMIKDHLKLVFNKKTPDRTFGKEFPSTQDIIDALHRPKPIDLIGKQWDENYWKLNPVQITC